MEEKNSSKKRVLEKLNLRLLTESNLERINRIEEKMDAFGNQLHEIAKMSSENRNRITEMKFTNHQELTNNTQNVIFKF